MKTLLSIVALLLIITTAHPQSFIGYSSGNYTGVNGVFFNPAYAANSRYHWDFSLMHVNASVYNDAVSYKLSSLTKNFNSDEMLKKLYGSTNASALANVDVLGPSLLFNINNKTAFAITTRYRVFDNLRGVNGTLLQSIKSDDAPASFDISNINIQEAATGWMEAGITWANVLYNGNKHFFKGGITLKYLGGISNGSVSTHNLDAAISKDLSKDSYFAGDASGNVSLSFAGASPSNISKSDLTKFNDKGAGIDIGLTYEYRPNSDNYKLADGSYNRSENLYKVRASVALLDMGSIRFNKDPQRSGNYTVGITGSDQFDLSTLNTDIDNIREAFDANPSLFTSVADSYNGKYKVSLPATLMTEVDYHFNKGFYLNLASHLSLARSNDIYKINNVNSIVVTPRIETPFLGIYVPVQVNNITGFDAGVAFRIGKIVMGSSNIITALGGSKMMNFYMGMRLFGSVQK